MCQDKLNLMQHLEGRTHIELGQIVQSIYRMMPEYLDDFTPEKIGQLICCMSKCDKDLRPKESGGAVKVR